MPSVQPPRLAQCAQDMCEGCVSEVSASELQDALQEQAAELARLRGRVRRAARRAAAAQQSLVQGAG